MPEELKYTYDSFFIDVKTLANEIKKSGKQYKSLLIVANGRLFIGALLAQELEINHIDTVSIKSYTEKEQNAIHIINSLDHVLKEKDVLIVDDIVDTGNTIKYLQERLKADTAVLFYKPEIAHTKPTYHLHETSKWVKFPWEK